MVNSTDRQQRPHDGDDPLPDRELDGPAQAILLEELGRSFSEPAAAFFLLDRIGYPNNNRPGFTNAMIFWHTIARSLNLGVPTAVRPPFHALLDAALHVYPYNPVLQPLSVPAELGVAPVGPHETDSDTSTETEADTDAETGAGASGTGTGTNGNIDGDDHHRPTCHVIVRIDSEITVGVVVDQLSQLDLGPRLEWRSDDAVAFAIDDDNVDQAWGRLGDLQDRAVVTAPGQPTYLLRSLLVQLPDRHVYELTDVPAAQQVRDVIQSVTDAYDPASVGAAGGRGQTFVADRVDEHGLGQRVDAEATVEEAGIRDGDTLRVGYSSTLGSVNPNMRQDAQVRARNQIFGYASTRRDFAAIADPPTVPSTFRLSFDQPSIAPPEPGGVPGRINSHVVELRLGPQFPVVAPTAFWLTQIYHPNVYPTYYGELARARPDARGFVCLGVLQGHDDVAAEAWYPSFDLGEVCQLLVELAGYRSYQIERVEITPDGGTITVGDCLDPDAGRWAQSVDGQRAITAIDGTPLAFVGRRPRPGYRSRAERIR
jgi:Effector-associated domain 1